MIRQRRIYEAEQAVLAEVSEHLLDAVADGTFGLDEILSDHFLRDLHLKLYGDIWTWAGRFRTRELNIGIAPEQIAVVLRASLENARYRWAHTHDWTARERNRRARCGCPHPSVYRRQR